MDFWLSLTSPPRCSSPTYRPKKTTAYFLARYRCHSRRLSSPPPPPFLSLSFVNMNSHTGSTGGLLPTLSRSAACPSPDATPFSSVSPSPPWSLGCDPQRSRGKAWLPVLDATCNCLPLSCSPQLPYTVPQRCAPLSQRIRKGLWGLRERHTRTEAATRAPEMQISSSPECKGNWKKREKSEEATAWVGQEGAAATVEVVVVVVVHQLFPSSRECLSSRKKKKIYSPNDATHRCGSGGGGGGGGGDGEGGGEGGYSVNTRQKK